MKLDQDSVYFLVFVAENIRRFLLSSWKTIPIFDNPSSKPLQRACCGIEKPACHLKVHKREIF
jgi:hypothetical protein